MGRKGRGGLVLTKVDVAKTAATNLTTDTVFVAHTEILTAVSCFWFPIRSDCQIRSRDAGLQGLEALLPLWSCFSKDGFGLSSLERKESKADDENRPCAVEKCEWMLYYERSRQQSSKQGGVPQPEWKTRRRGGVVMYVRVQ